MHENRETSETPAAQSSSRSAGEGDCRTARVYVSEESHRGIVLIVSADLKGSQFSRFRCEPERLPVVAGHTNAAAAIGNKQSRL